MAEFILNIETDDAQKVARLKLSNADGTHLAAHAIRLPEHSSALWEGLFDTRRYIERYQGAMIFDGQAEPATAAMLLQRLGLFLGEKVLGHDIFQALTGPSRRELVVQLPTTDQDVLAAAFARVPWEIARLADGTALRNLVLRAVTSATATGNAEVIEAAQAVSQGETLRVLAVFAEAPGARPLAMRREREQLRELFTRQILPHRRVEIDLLSHGVTRRRIVDAIRARDGYHIVHWSGHGHLNTLELQGEPDNAISGEALVELFSEAGGFVPQVFFLSACHSGALLRATDWASLQRALEQDEPPPAAKATAAATAAAPALAPPPTSNKQLEDAYQHPSGYAGTALTLLAAGVPQVIAMRYAVGDDYARQLALAFYQRLLADPRPRAADQALAMARDDVRQQADQAAYHAVDHATPLMFGQAGVLLAPTPGRSDQMARLWPRPQPLLDGGSHALDPATLFVGRGPALSRLGADWLGADGPAVALIQGLAGLGKTALAAEAIHLWHPGFERILAFQAKPKALPFDDFCRRIDQRLLFESPGYRQRCEQNPLDHIHLSHDPQLFAEPGSRHRRMRANLIEALRDQALLLVIDNFETHLESVERGAGSALYACADPAWEALLGELARELPATRSRLLLTSRRRPLALAPAAHPAAAGACLWIPLGPLPMPEAALFVRNHPGLRRLLFSSDADHQALIRRLLEVSRGHPLILDRLASLADRPDALATALDRVRAEGWQRLPDLFDHSDQDEAQQEAERRYLEEVAIGSVDLLIEGITPDARRLLRIVTVANEPVSEGFIDAVWQGKGVDDEQAEQLDQLAGMMEALEALPDDDPKKEALAQLFATDQGKQILAMLQNRSTDTGLPATGPLLTELRGTGLLSLEERGEEPPEQPSEQPGQQPAGQPTKPPPSYAFHELVRERMAHWRERHQDDDPRSDDAIRIAYGQRYAALFQQLYHQDRNAAGEAGRRALVYFVAAGAFERLGSFAGILVTGVNDPALLRSVVPELQGAIEQAPPGESRWRLRTYVADALDEAGQSDRALPFFAEAAAEAEAAGHWSDVASITGNWAGACLLTGDLDESKGLRLRSAEAGRRAGKPEVHAIAHELEALRIDVMRGGAEQALPEVEARLDRVRDWWRRGEAGEPVAEAPDRTFLGRALVGGLDIARSANLLLKRWQACLDLLRETESIQQALGEGELDLARSRFNQYAPLLGLGRLDQAQTVLEGCLLVFRANGGAVADQARCLSALADLWDERGEVGEAIALERQALAVRDTLPDPDDRAVSHLNLGNYYDKADQKQASAQHQLAAGIYFLVMGHRTHLATWSRNLGIRARRALASGGRYTLPTLTELLARPEFTALGQFLDARQVNRAALQADLDQLLDQAHQQPASSDAAPADGLPPELAELLGPIITAAQAGEDIEPLLTGLGQRLAGMGADEAQVTELLKALRDLKQA